MIYGEVRDMFGRLDEIMEFDKVIHVDPWAAVIDAPPGVYAPEVIDEEVFGDGWTLIDGYSGQHGYSGPIMHPSEYIGGALERHILSTPGYYALVASYDPDDEDGENAVGGWAIAYRETI